MSQFSKRVDNLLKTVEQESLDVSVKKEKLESNKGLPWVAGITLDGATGELRTNPKDAPFSNWDDELKSWGYDPAIYEVVEPVRVSTWQTYDERQLWAYRAQIKTKSGLTASELELMTAPVKRDKKRPKERHSGTYALVVPIGDWQIGKDDNDGLDGTVARIEASFEAVLDRAEVLRKIGYNIGHLVVCSLGDLGEGCTGHYEQQTYAVELDRRDQNKVVRRLARNALMKWATEFEQVTVAAVAGNHGENRRGSKSFTSTNDNDDVAIWEAVAETLSVRPELYGHIKWLLPREELSVSLQVGEKVLGLAHGHQARSGDIGRWWEGQALGNRPVSSADILLTGHFHHFRCAEVAKCRWHLQVPAQDGGSNWFEESSGRGSTTGQVTFLLSDNGWSELAIV
jgi:predicted phosphodiesterase